MLPDRGSPRHHVGDKSRAALFGKLGETDIDAGGHDFFPRRISPTCGTSLSPRPERLTTHQMIFRPLRRQLHHLGDGVRRLQRRNDAFQPRQQLKRRERFVVGGGQIIDPAGLVQPGMLRTDAGIIEPRRNRMRVLDLAVIVHQQIGAVAMQHAGPAAGDRGRMQLGEAMARGFDAENLDRGDRRGRDETIPSRWSRRRCRPPANPVAGLRPPASAPRVSVPITDWKSRTIIG